MKKLDSMLRYGSSFRVGLFAVSVVVVIVYLVRETEFSRAGYIVLGLGLMGLIYEVRQWRINRMPADEQLSATLSATEKKLD